MYLIFILTFDQGFTRRSAIKNVLVRTDRLVRADLLFGPWISAIDGGPIVQLNACIIRPH